MPTDPHWKLNVAAIFAIVSVALTGGVTVWGKADKAEVQQVRDRMYTKADQAEVSDLTRRVWLAETDLKLAAQQQQYILQDLKKANEKLDLLINTLINRRGGEASANTGGSATSRPGESAGTRSSDSGSSPVGPNPLSGQ